jgi:hypothetical protein
VGYGEMEEELIDRREFVAIYTLDYAYECTETIYDSNVHIFPTPHSDLCEKYFF